SEGNAVDGDRPFDNDVAEDVWRSLEAGDDRVVGRREGVESAGMLNNAAHEVPAKTPGEGEGALEVDGIAGLEVAEIGAAVGLVDNVRGESVLVEVDGGEVTAVDGNRI